MVNNELFPFIKSSKDREFLLEVCESIYNQEEVLVTPENKKTVATLIKEGALQVMSDNKTNGKIVWPTRLIYDIYLYKTKGISFASMVDEIKSFQHFLSIIKEIDDIYMENIDHIDNVPWLKEEIRKLLGNAWFLFDVAHKKRNGLLPVSLSLAKKESFDTLLILSKFVLYSCFFKQEKEVPIEKFLEGLSRNPKKQEVYKNILIYSYTGYNIACAVKLESKLEAMYINNKNIKDVVLSLSNITPFVLRINYMNNTLHFYDPSIFELSFQELPLEEYKTRVLMWHSVGEFERQITNMAFTLKAFKKVENEEFKQYSNILAKIFSSIEEGGKKQTFSQEKESSEDIEGTVEESKELRMQDNEELILKLHTPKIPFDQVVLDPVSHQEVSEMLFFIKNKNKLREWGLDTNNNKMIKSEGVKAIFYGIPGTGKTVCAEAIAYELKYKYIVCDAASFLSKWYGETEKKVKKFLEDYEKVLKENDNKVVLILDEADQLLHRRIEGNSSASITDNRVENILLSGFEKLNGVVIATTNLYENLDPAWERRFDYRIEFKMPGYEERKKLWRVHIPEKMPLADDVNIDMLAKYELTGAFIQNAVKKAAKIAIQANLSKVTQDCFEEAVKKLVPKDRREPVVGFIKQQQES